MFAPVYSLCADLEDGTGRELLVCRKVSGILGTRNCLFIFTNIKNILLFLSGWPFEVSTLAVSSTNHLQ